MHHRNTGQAKEAYIMNCITFIASSCNCHTTSLLIIHNIINNQTCILDLHCNDYLIRHGDGSGNYCNPNVALAASLQDDQEPGRHIPFNNKTIACLKIKCIESSAESVR